MTGFIEQVPHYSVNYMDDGVHEKISLTVQLPGVEAAADIEVQVDLKQIYIHIPGKYKLSLPLEHPVQDEPEFIRFVKKKSVLKAQFVAIPKKKIPAEAVKKPPAAPTLTSAAPPSNNKPAVHDSFFEDLQKSLARKSTNKNSVTALKLVGSSSTVASAAVGPQVGAAPAPAPAVPTSTSGIEAAGSNAPVSETGNVKHTALKGNQKESAAETPTLTELVNKPPPPAVNQHAAAGAAAATSSDSTGRPTPPATLDGIARQAAAHQPEHLRRSVPSSSKALLVDSQAAGADRETPERLYDLGKVQANREAAVECAQRATELAQGGEKERANKLLAKAASLWPEQYASVNAEAEQKHRDQSTKGAATEGIPNAQEKQHDGDSSHSSYDKGGHDINGGTGGRSSQPYSFVSPPSAASSAARTRSQEPHKEGGAPHPSPPQQPPSQPGRPPQNGAVRGPGKPETRGGGGGGAAGTGRRADTPSSKPGGSASGSAAAGAQKAPSPPPPSPPPPPPPPPPSSADSKRAPDSHAEDEDSGSYFNLKRILDLVFSSFYKRAAGYGKYATTCVGVLHIVVMFVITAMVMGTVLCASCVPLLVSAVSKKRARKMSTAMMSSNFLLIAFAAPIALVAFYLAWSILSLLYSPLLYVLQLVWFITSALIWEPHIVVSSLASMLWVVGVDSEKKPYSWRLWLIPLTMYFSGQHLWCLSSLVVLFVLYLLSACSGIVSAAATVAGLRCIQYLRWYKAIPAVLAVIIGWVLAVVNSPKEGRQDSNSKSESSNSGHGTNGNSSNSSWWGKAKQKTEVPKGASGEVARVLQSSDFYEVLEIPRSADEESVRKAKRLKSLATHPDKLGGAVGAKEAFQRVTEAVDVLSDSAKRKDYDKKLRLEEERATASGSQAAWADDEDELYGYGGFSTSGTTGKKEMEMPCRSCGKTHMAVFTDIAAATARYCSRCKTCHAAKDGESWIDKQGGFWAPKKVYVCFLGVILDITEYARCNDLLHDSQGNPIEANTCHIPLRFGSKQTDKKGGGTSAAGRSRKKGKKR
ncbi:hypothetical protein CEUSTIGMA_g695.t1 [Chlamydomonas eustigma]|uniref:J domain-containing protein n=1 Tax=Chlamydomonas eustigma TaxID=1157962 RepID=A0A250WR21_9CHLO|nr:hypothetical protein CEUSTIGMA_g695.t1 [Chlamydomonas eustigma]|eukprot:GAX73241.1 hypothetical protein CEUSTIGMA_g695.t1 [Chlamydomonas eustigma]